MSFWLRAASFAQTTMENVQWSIRWARQHLLVPVAHAGGRNMQLLRSGCWIDADIRVDDSSQVVAVYIRESHSIRLPQSPLAANARMTRWTWLSVSLTDSSGGYIDAEVNSNEVLTEFMGTLRTETDAITPGQILTLFACQKGWLPTGYITVVSSTGDEETLTCADLYAPGR